jgi:hypothetical protein
MNVNELLPLHRIPQPLYDAIENALREAVLRGTTSVVQRQDIIEAAKNYASLVAQQRCASAERELATLKVAVSAIDWKQELAMFNAWFEQGDKLPFTPWHAWQARAVQSAQA